MASVIGLLVDRGLPEKRVRELLAGLNEELEAQERDWSAELGQGGAGQWVDMDEEDWLTTPEVPTMAVRSTLEVKVGTLPMDDSGNVLLADSAPGIMQEYGWSRMVYVTDLPLTTQRPVISQTVHNGSATMLCLPAFGLLRAKEGLRQELSRLVRGLPAGAGVRQKKVDDIAGGDADADSTRVLEGRGRTIRLLLGMIHCNRPGNLLKVLTGCMALGIATGGFGIFYASLWALSNYLPLWRLGFITVVAIVVLTFWLIFHNGLWNSWTGRRELDAVAWWRARWDNLATLGTVLLVTVAIYATIFLVLLLLALIIVPPEYYNTQIADEADFMAYLRLAWLSASLGALAGALGSSFDSEDAIREATYNRRELRRRKITGLFDDSEN